MLTISQHPALHENLVLSNELIKGELPPWKIVVVCQATRCRRWNTSKTYTQKALKILNKTSSFNYVHSIRTESMKHSHSINLLIHNFMSPYFHQCQSSLTSSYKPKTTRKSFVRTGAVLTLKKSAFQIFHGGNSTFVNSFDKTKFHTSLFHWRSTTVSLESRILNTQCQINS